MNIDATFWVSVSFFIFIGGLIYLKVPQKISAAINEKINEIKKEINEAEKLKDESKKLLDDFEVKISKSQKESKNIIDEAKKASEKIILEKTKKFHQIMEERKKNTEQKIVLMKDNALREIRNISIKISIKAVENLVKNAIDKNKLEKIYTKSIEETKIALKQTKI